VLSTATLMALVDVGKTVLTGLDGRMSISIDRRALIAS